jgi:hypothetical protein
MMNERIRARIVLVFAVIAALAFVAVLSGCGGQSTADANKEKCFANIALIQAEMKLFKEDSGIDAPLADVVSKLHVACPSGGTYSYDATSGVVTCSIHGHP